MNSEIQPVRRCLAALTLTLVATLAGGCGGADTGAESDTDSDPSAIGEDTAALGATYLVGPSRMYKSLQAVASLLAPGDVVEVDGGATYAGGVVFTKNGTSAAKITIRGVRVNGKRPVLSGGSNTVELAGNHYVIEGFDITGGSGRCVFHHGNAITVRDTVVHNCPAHGILGADSDSGSLTLEYVEVYACGSGTQKHQIYMATDESAYPGSVFRMQHCYVHDGNGGNNVKTRAQRNEIYYNWVEGGYYRELELIGPDGQSPGLAREDSDVVGNVLRKTSTATTVRIGGDGTGDTDGRYRFVNNTFLLRAGSGAAVQIFDGIESVELHNNAFYRVGGGGVTILDDGGVWSTGTRIIAGRNNLVPQGSTTPAQWTATLVNSNPGFVDVAARNVKLLANSPLINAGAAAPASPAGHAFPSPLTTPLYTPPLGAIQAVNTAVARPVVGIIDIGAFEYGEGSAPPPPPPPVPATCQNATPNVWLNTAFANKTGSFTAHWDVTPTGPGVDGGVAVALGSQTTWNGLAAIVRFNPAGVIDVRSGDVYKAATAVPYTSGATYHVRMVVNVTTKTYSVYVTAPGKAEALLAAGYPFRTQQAQVASLNTWVVTQAGLTGSIKACNFTAQ